MAQVYSNEELLQSLRQPPAGGYMGTVKDASFRNGAWIYVVECKHQTTGNTVLIGGVRETSPRFYRADAGRADGDLVHIIQSPDGIWETVGAAPVDPEKYRLVPAVLQAEASTNPGGIGTTTAQAIVATTGATIYRSGSLLSAGLFHKFQATLTNEEKGFAVGNNGNDLSITSNDWALAQDGAVARFRSTRRKTTEDELLFLVMKASPGHGVLGNQDGCMLFEVCNSSGDTIPVKSYTVAAPQPGGFPNETDTVNVLGLDDSVVSAGDKLYVKVPAHLTRDLQINEGATWAQGDHSGATEPAGLTSPAWEIAIKEVGASPSASSSFIRFVIEHSGHLITDATDIRVLVNVPHTVASVSLTEVDVYCWIEGLLPPGTLSTDYAAAGVAPSNGAGASREFGDQSRKDKVYMGYWASHETTLLNTGAVIPASIGQVYGAGIHSAPGIIAASGVDTAAAELHFVEINLGLYSATGQASSPSSIIYTLAVSRYYP